MTPGAHIPASAPDSAATRHARADAGAAPGARKLHLLAYGHPLDPRTFSGYSANLGQALRRAGMLGEALNIRDFRATDALRRAFIPRRLLPRPRIDVDRRWLWSREGHAVLSRRLARRLDVMGLTGPFLQVGTLATTPPERGPHAMLTDMTIAQARRAGRFGFEGFTDRQAEQAMEAQRRIMSTAAHVFTLSRWTAESVIADCGVPGRLVTVVHAGSNLAIPEDLHEARRPREILFVGIDWERKGGPLLLEAFRIVRDALPDATLTIVGCRPAIDEPGVRIEGFLSRSAPDEFVRLARCYARAACFCLPALFDPFPNVIIEAASVGLPTVALDSGSRREAIDDGVTGRLTPIAAEPSARLLAEDLIAVIADEERCLAMGRAAKRRADDLFTWERVIERIERTMWPGTLDAEPDPRHAGRTT
ncbi:MAG TPA: glycosyltransferase family 4 protein [Phycisphaerales bacterium]|nr:glycosyltransferase family 4 protein [Phycisphaerales bacterium]